MQQFLIRSRLNRKQLTNVFVDHRLPDSLKKKSPTLLSINVLFAQKRRSL